MPFRTSPKNPDLIDFLPSALTSRRGQILSILLASSLSFLGGQAEPESSEPKMVTPKPVKTAKPPVNRFRHFVLANQVPAPTPAEQKLEETLDEFDSFLDGLGDRLERGGDRREALYKAEQEGLIPRRKPGAVHELPDWFYEERQVAGKDQDRLDALTYGYLDTLRGIASMKTQILFRWDSLPEIDQELFMELSEKEPQSMTELREIESGLALLMTQNQIGHFVSLAD